MCQCTTSLEQWTESCETHIWCSASPRLPSWKISPWEPYFGGVELTEQNLSTSPSVTLSQWQVLLWSFPLSFCVGAIHVERHKHKLSYHSNNEKKHHSLFPMQLEEQAACRKKKKKLWQAQQSLSGLSPSTHPSTPDARKSYIKKRGL